ncbi:MAG: hypothetical protein M3033_08840 [Acidobacteriota bacterium]|nr:hypothetical protein [Acidobacteriota bacterium]
MKTRAKLSNAFIFLLLFCFLSNANSQGSKNPLPADQIKDAQSAVAELRELYKLRDFESGYETGRKLIEQFPDNTELQAWFISNMARNEMSKDAVEAAKKLVENNPENAWAWFVLAHAYVRNLQTTEALPPVKKH